MGQVEIISIGILTVKIQVNVTSFLVIRWRSSSFSTPLQLSTGAQLPALTEFSFRLLFMALDAVLRCSDTNLARIVFASKCFSYRII